MFKRFVAALLLGVVASVAVAGVAHAGWKQSKETVWCSMLRAQPAYSYEYDGAEITVPSGKRLLKYDVYADYRKGSKASDRACKALVREYREHVYGW